MSSKNTPNRIKSMKNGPSSESKSNSSKTGLSKSNWSPNSVNDLRSFPKTPTMNNKSKSLVSLNACYTPTSLYKNLGATPNSDTNELHTPKSIRKRFVASMEAKSTPECFSKVSFDTPKQLATRNTSLDDRIIKSKDKAEMSNLKVAVRVRPMNVKECKTPSLHSIVITGNEITVLGGHTADNSAGVSHSFQYDDVYWSGKNVDNDQNTVFRGTALPLVDLAFEGKNTCLFAYGQTGSGKSYSMMGMDAGELALFN